MKYQIFSKCMYVTICFFLQGTFSFAGQDLEIIPEPIPSQLDQNITINKSADISYKNENVAWILPLATTLATVAGGTIFALNTKKYQGAGVGLALAGLVVGPSLGHFYAGETGRGMASSMGRLAGAGVMVLGLGMIYDQEEIGVPLGLVGLVTVGLLTLRDICDAPSAVKRHNDKVQQISIAPMMLAPPPGKDNSTMAYGLSLSGRF